jgi:integrase
VGTGRHRALSPRLRLIRASIIIEIRGAIRTGALSGWASEPSIGTLPVHHSIHVGDLFAGQFPAQVACASLLFARGANIKQVQRWLGHRSPTITLETYVHLLGDDLGEPLSLDRELPPGLAPTGLPRESGEEFSPEPASASAPG